MKYIIASLKIYIVYQHLLNVFYISQVLELARNGKKRHAVTQFIKMKAQ